MKIDMFNHFFPQRFFYEYMLGSGLKDIGKRMLNIPLLVDLEKRFRVMDEYEDYRQVLSLPSPPLEIMAPPQESPLLAQVANDGLAELVVKHPDRFVGFVASLPMNNVDAALREMQRAITKLGAKGIQIFTQVAGKPLDLPEFEPIFEEAARCDTVIWLHPARAANFSDYRSEDRSRYEIWWALGWPYETSVAMSRLVFARIFDRFPNLKILTHHLGGMIPYFEGRIDLGWEQLGTRTTGEDYGAVLRSLKKRPIEYFRQFYGDTALFGSLAANRCGVDFFGVDHVVYATDMPFDPQPGRFIRETIRVVEGLGLTAAEKDKIYYRNAERLLKLVPQAKA
jgi:predicted TIM-barrel fold metal-dependent hydrolase